MCAKYIVYIHVYTYIYIRSILQPYFKHIGFFELLANTDVEKIMARTFCREGMKTQPICEFIISSVGGFSDSETDRVSYRHISRVVRAKRDSDLRLTIYVRYIIFVTSFQTHLHEYLQFAPAGCSFKQLLHYSMGIQNPGINSVI